MLLHRTEQQNTDALEVGCKDDTLKQHSRCRLGHDKDTGWSCSQCLEKKRKKKERESDL